MTPSWSSSTSRSSPIHSVSKLFSNGLALRLVPRMAELVEENQTGSSEGGTFTTTSSWLDECCMPIVTSFWQVLRLTNRMVVWCGMDIALRGQCMVAWKIACALKSSVMEDWECHCTRHQGSWLRRPLGFHGNDIDSIFRRKPRRLSSPWCKPRCQLPLGKGHQPSSCWTVGCHQDWSVHSQQTFSGQSAGNPRNWTATRRTPFSSNTQQHVSYHFFSRSMDKI